MLLFYFNVLAYAEWTVFHPYFDILFSQKLFETVYCI